LGGMKFKNPFSSNEDENFTREVSLIQKTDYDIEDEYKVADFDPQNVKNEYLDIFHTTSIRNRSLLIAMFKRKTFKSAIIGVTWVPLLVFIVFYYVFQIPYQLGGFRIKSCGDNSDHSKPESEAEAATCHPAWHDWVATMRENESTCTRYLTFILGFYVSQMIRRWWDMIVSLPDIDSITNSIAGFVQLEFKDDELNAKEAALVLKKRVVRYCLLSWTMCMATISPPLKEKFRIGEHYIEKGLVTETELNKLQTDRPTSWRDQWWIPITWAISLVNANHPDSQGCKIKDQKDFISQLNKYQSKLHHVSLYLNNPLPLIYGQALIFVIYAWMILGIFGSQYLDIQHDASVAFFSFPFFQCIKIMLIYAWMQVANIVRNPFGTDDNYDIDLGEMLDHNIWKASLSIKHMDNPIYIH